MSNIHDKDVYREKFRPETDPALEQEASAALEGISLESLGGADQAQPAGALRMRGTCRGRIIRVGKEEVFVDLGGKAQGVAPLVQFEEIPQVGQEMEFHIDRYEPRDGLVLLNRKGAVAANVTWDNLEVGQVVEGIVTGMNKGGLEVQVRQMRAFMPAGQVDIVFHKDISIFIGQRVTGEVTHFDRERKNLIISRRNVLERQREEARRKLLEDLGEGQIRRGTVRNVTEYGAFVDLGGVDGLVHISEISHKRIKHAGEVLKVGDMVDVKILKIDPETGRIALSLKQATADPWTDAATRYPVGAAVTARVARIEGFGAFLEIEEGVEGLLPISEISWQRIKHPSEVLHEGDTIKVVVLSVDPVQRRMSFSLKQAGGDPWATIDQRFARDMVVSGRVTRTADFGAFVELEPGLEGLVHISELANRRVAAVEDVVKPGADVRVRILDIDRDKRRISLSIRRAEEPAAGPTAPGATQPPKKAKPRPQLRGGLEF